MGEPGLVQLEQWIVGGDAVAMRWYCGSISYLRRILNSATVGGHPTQLPRLARAPDHHTRKSLRVKRLVGCGVGGSVTADRLEVDPHGRRSSSPQRSSPREPRFALAVAKPAAARELASPRRSASSNLARTRCGSMRLGRSSAAASRMWLAVRIFADRALFLPLPWLSVPGAGPSKASGKTLHSRVHICWARC